MKDIKALHPGLQQKIVQLRKLCEKNGLKIGISECLRTVAEQDALYAAFFDKADEVLTDKQSHECKRELV